MAETHSLKLVSFDLCPYVERSRIVLEEKKVSYDIEYVDLKNKPAWFLEISPRGKVPVLVVDGRPIFESMVINELLEELYPEPRLFPTDPLARAEARSWIVFCNDVVMSASSELRNARTEETRGVAKDAVESAFTRLEKQLRKSGGKFFFGDSFGLVDAVYAPFFARFEITASLVGGMSFEKFPALAKYVASVTSYPTAVRARAERFVERYTESVRATMSGTSGY